MVEILNAYPLLGGKGRSANDVGSLLFGRIGKFCDTNIWLDDPENGQGKQMPENNGIFCETAIEKFATVKN